jgi:hypothetical protein
MQRWTKNASAQIGQAALLSNRSMIRGGTFEWHRATKCLAFFLSRQKYYNSSYCPNQNS